MALSIPQRCKVLVIGGGPGGSYAAAALARENIDVVLLEGDKFPRYHIGESMLASIRHLLRFIDLDSTFDKYGFVKKVGAAFKFRKDKREGFTDFVAAGGPNNYAWNVVRSEADHLIFKHSGKEGAKTFDGVQVKTIEFVEQATPDKNGENLNPGRPVKATYAVMNTKDTGEIYFDYVIDASGRVGLLSNKYMKNRRYNQGLKNVANWGYWEGCGTYAPGTPRENSPFFEALQDESGWAWFIPLHNGTVSVGLVMDQALLVQRKASNEYGGTQDFYLSCLRSLAPSLTAIIGGGKLVSTIKSASDYSYSASSYAFPHARIVGDAGCFIDPYFSSGVHLALTGALSAVTTICAAIRGDCSEVVAADWHSKKISDAYTRFLFVVLSAYKQIRSQSEPVLSDIDEDNFDRAFAFFRPIIQGTADAANSKLTQAELNQTLEFCTNAFAPGSDEDLAVAMEKINDVDSTGFHPDLSPEQLRAVKQIRARQMIHAGDTINLDSFGIDAIDGLVPILVRGSLGLRKQDSLG